MQTPRWTLRDALVVLLVLAVAAALAFPAIVTSAREDREKRAYRSLYAILQAEEAFRAVDRDANGVADFWTANIYGLHGVQPLRGPPRPALDETLALADGRSATHDYRHISPSKEGRASSGYIFRTLGSYEDMSGFRDVFFRTLREDTDGEGAFGAVHHPRDVVIAAYPLDERAGRRLFLIDSGGRTVDSEPIPDAYRCAFAPLRAGRDSESTITGTGVRGLDNASFYPSGRYVMRRFND